MTYETVLYDVADRICTITLNRPEKLNAWTRQMDLDPATPCERPTATREVRAIILTGAGRGFCAGADMGVLQRSAPAAPADAAPRQAPTSPAAARWPTSSMTYSYFPASRSRSSPRSTAPPPASAS